MYREGHRYGEAYKIRDCDHQKEVQWHGKVATNRVLECYTPRGAGLSISDIIAGFEPGDLDLDDITSIDTTPFCRVCIDQQYKTSRCRQLAIRTIFGRTRNKTFLVCSARNQRFDFSETANTDERRARSSYSRGAWGWKFSGYRIFLYYSNRDPSIRSAARSENRDFRTRPTQTRSGTKMKGSHDGYPRW